MVDVEGTQRGEQLRGVLVAVSIPIFTAQLEKSRESTDLANLRAAKAEAISTYLLADATDTSVTWKTAGNAGDGFTAYYDAPSGKLVATKPTAGYGKGTNTTGSSSNTDFNYNPGASVSNLVIKVDVDGAGECTFSWE